MRPPAVSPCLLPLHYPPISLGHFSNFQAKLSSPRLLYAQILAFFSWEDGPSDPLCKHGDTVLGPGESLPTVTWPGEPECLCVVF